MWLELDCGSETGGDKAEMRIDCVLVPEFQVRAMESALRECVEALEGIHGGTLNISKAADYLRIDTAIKRAKELLPD